MKKLIAAILAFTVGFYTPAFAANLWELRDSNNVTQGNITDAATPVIEQMDLNGNATTSSALAANGTNCSANQFNKGVDEDGSAESCAALVDADVPDTITVDLAAAATALASDPTDCGANTFAESIDASGDLTCDGVDEASIDPSAVTSSKLAASAVTTPKLANDAVTGEKILNGVVTEAKLSFDTATQSELDTHDGTTDAHFDHADDLSELNTQLSSSIADGPHTGATEFEGRDTTANICTATPSQAGNWMISSTDFDIYTSTASALPGQWRNSRTGIGPC